MDKKTIYHCEACGKPFEVEQGSRRRYCVPCATKRILAGKAQEKEAK